MWKKRGKYSPDNARSQLKILQNQLLYEPPGELVRTRRVKPVAWSKLNEFTTRNPRNGMTKNCKKRPRPSALTFFSCAWRESTLTVADMPNIRQNSRTVPRTSRDPSTMFAEASCPNRSCCSPCFVFARFVVRCVCFTADNFLFPHIDIYVLKPLLAGFRTTFHIETYVV
jgi:hypothetical protein